MIALIYGRAGDAQYVPAKYDPQGHRWIPLIDDRGRVGMTSWQSAARACALELARNLQGMAIDANGLCSLASGVTEGAPNTGEAADTDEDEDAPEAAVQIRREHAEGGMPVRRVVVQAVR